MRVIRTASVLFTLFGFALALLALPQPSVSSGIHLSSAQSPSAESIPAYHPQPPTGTLPATMAPDSFSDPLVQNAYTVAARVKKVLYQQPCYCHCDRSQGHTGLLDCFVSSHGSGCQICIREDLYTYEQSHKGKTPAQIREGIINGDWQSVDISKYQTPLPVAHK